MQVTREHLERFLQRRVFSVHRVILRWRGSTVGIRLRHEGPRSIGAAEFETLHRLFGSKQFHVPSWQILSEGCDTCGDGSIAELDFIEISDADSLETVIERAALLRWEMDLDREEQQRQLEQQRREEERRREQRRQANLAEQVRQRKLKEQVEELYKHGLDDVFDKLWDIYQPLLGMPGREYYERTQRLPKEVVWLLRPLQKSKVQTKEGCRAAFDKVCQQAPKKMRKTLFPDGKILQLNYRCVRLQRDDVMRTKQRQLEQEGYRVF